MKKLDYIVIVITLLFTGFVVFKLIQPREKYIPNYTPIPEEQEVENVLPDPWCSENQCKG